MKTNYVLLLLFFVALVPLSCQKSESTSVKLDNTVSYTFHNQTFTEKTYADNKYILAISAALHENKEILKHTKKTTKGSIDVRAIGGFSRSGSYTVADIEGVYNKMGLEKRSKKLATNSKIIIENLTNFIKENPQLRSFSKEQFEKLFSVTFAGLNKGKIKTTTKANKLFHKVQEPGEILCQVKLDAAMTQIDADYDLQKNAAMAASGIALITCTGSGPGYLICVAAAEAMLTVALLAADQAASNATDKAIADYYICIAESGQGARYDMPKAVRRIKYSSI